MFRILEAFVIFKQMNEITGEITKKSEKNLETNRFQIGEKQMARGLRFKKKFKKIKPRLFGPVWFSQPSIRLKLQARWEKNNFL